MFGGPKTGTSRAAGDRVRVVGSDMTGDEALPFQEPLSQWLERELGGSYRLQVGLPRTAGANALPAV